MQINKLQLINFRNYQRLELDFSDSPTIFIGSNGAGKSNILEAVYLLSTTKSPRIDEEVEFIKKGEEAATIKCFAEDTELMITMVGDGDIKRFGKRVSVNGVGRRITDFIGNLPAVIFWPSDINMVTGSPSLRRWHLDLSLAQAYIPYKKALTLYEQILSNRNRILKRVNEGIGRRDELTYWTDELIREGKVISDKRKEFFEFINNIHNPIGNFVFEYHPNELSYEQLEQYKDKEVAAMNTLIGPHRDDFGITLIDYVIPPSADGGIQLAESDKVSSNHLLDPRPLRSEASMHGDDKRRDMSKFGSRGEQRMATLAFKMAQLEYMAYILGKRPVLLLDDVFSELDVEHRAVVAKISLMQQTIIATVELENIPQEFLDKSRIIKVENGVLH